MKKSLDVTGVTAPTAPSNEGLTPERRRQAEKFLVEAGIGKANRRITMLDDQLGRALVRKFVDAGEYAALRKYALHWLAGGLQGHLASADLNRIMAPGGPGAMSGLAKTERQAFHRATYWEAHEHLGTRPAFVADHIACFDTDLADVAIMLGYRSRFRGREKVKELLADAGYRLIRLWR